MSDLARTRHLPEPVSAEGPASVFWLCSNVPYEAGFLAVPRRRPKTRTLSMTAVSSTLVWDEGRWRECQRVHAVADTPATLLTYSGLGHGTNGRVQGYDASSRTMRCAWAKATSHLFQGGDRR
jgi:hypothetical protein